MAEFNFGQTMNKERLGQFAEFLRDIQSQVGFKVSARGWCYQMEGKGIITKAEFDKVESAINTCRERGILPIDFTAEEEGRQFSGVEEPDEESPLSLMKTYLNAAMNAEQYYTPDWWNGEDYYIQMVVEKIDLKTLFEPVCGRFHIPIATAKGWASMLMRATYARRFREAESRDLKCVLLYCGDHDPDGLRISEFLRSNLDQLKDVTWENGDSGYDPADLIIDRFGLNYDFISKNKLTWIDNLITGSKGYIATTLNGRIVQGRTKGGKPHPNFPMAYAQDYLKRFGVRKCEANAIVTMPKEARVLVEEAITKYLGKGAEKRFKAKTDAVFKELRDIREETGLDDALEAAMETIDKRLAGEGA